MKSAYYSTVFMLKTVSISDFSQSHFCMAVYGISHLIYLRFTHLERHLKITLDGRNTQLSCLFLSCRDQRYLCYLTLLMFIPLAHQG